MGLLLIALMFGVIYFFMIRPQQKKVQAQRELINNLEIGDVVITSSGIYGAVAEIEETVVWLEVAPEIELKVAKMAIEAMASAIGDDDEEDDELEAADAGDDEG